MNFDFLKDVTVSAAPIAAKAAPVSRLKQRQPEGEVTTIRLFKDGSVYPSDHLTQLMSLEYGKRDENNKPVGYGIDVIDSRDMTSQFKAEQPFVGVAFVPRAEGKTDLFASCQYNEDGSPASTVATQGSTTYGKEQLIPLLQEVYGADFSFNEAGYVDLDVLGDEYGLKSPDGRFFVFKRISRGPNKGAKDYAIRVGATIFPLVPVSAEKDTVTTSDATIAVPRTRKGSTNTIDNTVGILGDGPGNPFGETTEADV